MQLSRLIAHKILNSRKEETIAVIAEVKGKRVEASAPSGTSVGKHEVRAFSSRGLDFSISFVNAFGKKLVDEKIKFETFDDLKKLETFIKKYDQTKNLEFIGGNTLYALEAAILKALAISREQELWTFLLEDKEHNPSKLSKPSLPKPLGNCIGGGLHVKQQNKTDFQEFLILPKTKYFFDSYFINMQAYKEAKSLLKEKDKEWQGTLTDENALASTLDNESVLALLQEVRQKIKDKFDIDISLGIDMAATALWKGRTYKYKNYTSTKKEKTFTKEEQISYVSELARKNSLVYIEDPLHEEDFDGFNKLKTNTPNIFICGDDLTCTKLERLERAIKSKAINALIVKPNQAGSLLETKEVIDLAKKHDILTIISHRSGETYDNTIAHLAVGWQIPLIKTGIIGKERFAKLHELLRIERMISIK